MLVRFVVSNYLSFGEETEFNMLTSSVRRKKEHIYKFGNIELLKTAAIYGPNGAGKSNLIKAIQRLKDCVANRDGINTNYWNTFRLNNSFNSRPTEFEIEFTASERMYAYGISIQSDKIIKEWLYRIENKNEKLIFERKLENDRTKIDFNPKMLVTGEDKLRIKLYEEELLPDYKTLLQMIFDSKLDLKEIDIVYKWIVNNLQFIRPNSEFKSQLPNFFNLSENAELFTNEFLKSFNTGIFNLKVETIDLDTYFGWDDREKAESIRKEFERNKNKTWIRLENDSNYSTAYIENEKIVIKRLITIHKNELGEFFDFEIDEESDGTRRILDFILPFYAMIKYDFTVLIDEIDQSIHPHLLKKLVAKFVNDNNTKGQLIFTTHDSNLLDQNIFRQDEIWFTEKKNTGETTMYPLSDFKIRYDLDIEKGYLKGRFGAIPFMGNLEGLNWHEYAS